MMRHLLVAALLIPLAETAVAGSTFQPPAGCSVFLTVQSRGCRVSNHYTCAADAAGDQWRADFDQEGLFFLSRTDSEAQWVESFDFFPTVRQTLDPNAEDPASFSGLLSTGLDTFAFGLTRDNGEQSHVTGFDRLTGRTTTIDGVTLEETEFEYEETDPSGTLMRRSKGNEYISREWRSFFAGPSEWDGGEGYVPIDGSPVEFILPGEPGFAATAPLFDCDATLSSYPMSTPKKESGHDDL